MIEQVKLKAWSPLATFHLGYGTDSESRSGLKQPVDIGYESLKMDDGSIRSAPELHKKNILRRRDYSVQAECNGLPSLDV